MPWEPPEIVENSTEATRAFFEILIAGIEEKLTYLTADARYVKKEEEKYSALIKTNVTLPSGYGIYYLTIETTTPEIILPGKEKTSFTIFTVQDSTGSREPKFIAPEGMTMKWARRTVGTYTKAPSSIDSFEFIVPASNYIAASPGMVELG